jgi:hypothetical protein
MVGEAGFQLLQRILQLLDSCSGQTWMTLQVTIHNTNTTCCCGCCCGFCTIVAVLLTVTTGAYCLVEDGCHGAGSMQLSHLVVLFYFSVCEKGNVHSNFTLRIKV